MYCDVVKIRDMFLQIYPLRSNQVHFDKMCVLIEIVLCHLMMCFISSKYFWLVQLANYLLKIANNLIVPIISYSPSHRDALWD